MYINKNVKDSYKHKKYCKNAKNVIILNKEAKNNLSRKEDKIKNNNLLKKRDSLNIKIDFNLKLNETYLRAGEFFYWNDLFIGGGAKINTYIGADKYLDNIYAFKIQNKNNKYNYCRIEYEILSNLKTLEYVPKIIGEGEINGKYYILETLSG